MDTADPALLTSHRFPLLPDVPTMQELGFPGDAFGKFIRDERARWIPLAKTLGVKAD